MTEDQVGMKGRIFKSEELKSHTFGELADGVSEQESIKSDDCR